jgi:6-phosphogluconate dehydrogenase
MQLAMVGLGRMGANMVRRLMQAGHACVVYDVNPESVQELAGEGAVGAASLAEMYEKLAPPRHVWVMVPAAITPKVVHEIADLLDPNDTIIDGGNSYYKDDIDMAVALQPQGIHYVDCGTSGGVWGLERGYCLMIGGEDEPVQRLAPVFEALSPGIDAAARTPGLTGEPSPAEYGWLHCGSNGAGHFVKMVHNGIEYALMAAYGEGLNIIKSADIGRAKVDHALDAETTPLRDPQYYNFDIDVAAVAEVWRRGSVIGSWLLDLTAAALHADPNLEAFGGQVSDSGEGRWTSIAAIEEGVPALVLTASLYSRFASRGLGRFAYQVQSAQRKQFGGHDERVAHGE